MENKLKAKDNLDALLYTLWNDYEEENENEKDKEEPFEKYYKQGWNDAIEHIQEFLSRVK